MESGARVEVQMECELDVGSECRLVECGKALSTSTMEWCSRQYTELPGLQQRQEIVLAETIWILNLELVGMEGLSGAFTVPGNTTLVSAQSMEGL